MPPSSLRTRLQRLHRQTLKRRLPPSVPAEVLAARQEHRQAAKREAEERAVLPGEEVVTPLGPYQLIENAYPLDFPHGPARLADVFAHSPQTAALLAREQALAQADLRSLAFLDTETTGLAGGTGTLVFLVGVGAVEGGRFVLRQYFLRDPGDEPALLTAVLRDLAPRAGWVTFNGRAFDLPLLETRLTLNGQRGALGQRPHLDLLAPARRLYRGRLPSCSLGDIEQHVLHILREQDDVPGALIPQMYLDYLRTGDASEMRRVIYHNAVDILSMVTLAAHLLQVFATPLRPQRPASGSIRARAPESGLQPEDLLRLARWHDDNGRLAEAEQAYRRALGAALPRGAGSLSLEDRRVGLARLAALLKRLGRRAEAVPLWEQLASFTLDDPAPFVELAKYYEWHAPDAPRAVAWAERALSVVAGWPRGWRRTEATAALQHRLQRLKGKSSVRAPD
jgi:hypothetical protein